MKKIALVVAIILLIALATTACSDKNSTHIRASDNMGKLVHIEGLLSYDRDTKVVYYYFKDSAPQAGYGYMSPYISENGKFCKYEKGDIVEIEEAKQ